MLITVPPADGYGTSGVSSAGIGPTDTLVFVVDIEEAANVLKRATGDPVKAKKGLPTVKLNKKTGEPTITVPDSKAPDSLVVQPLIEGKGEKVEKGQTITVQYTGVIWPGGKAFDSSWKNGAAASFEIGSGRVITGWDKGLVGKTVGSQILLVIPPDEATAPRGSRTPGSRAPTPWSSSWTSSTPPAETPRYGLGHHGHGRDVTGGVIQPGLDGTLTKPAAAVF